MLSFQAVVAVTVPPSGSVSVNVCGVSVDGSSERSNVAVTFAPDATLVAPGAGVRPVIEGAPGASTEMPAAGVVGPRPCR